METNKNQILHGECPRKLNLNVPPLSTRRLSSATTNTNSKTDTANMVPFSWERIPGEPKDKETNDTHLPPPPRPPPCRWQPPLNIDYGDHNERFSDAIDIFSLAESGDDDMEATKDITSEELNNNSHHSPNFIIERFLPDAQALAEASVMNKKFSSPASPCYDSSFSRAVSMKRSHNSPKGCGLGSFLPWRMKRKPCSVKSPVCDTIIGSNLKHKR